jgi:hypothetical protein
MNNSHHSHGSPAASQVFVWKIATGRFWRSRLVLLAGSTAAVLVLNSCGSKTDETPQPGPAATTNAPARASAPQPELAKLAGKWERADGGYVLEIRSVGADGKLEAAYFNPNPINISRAVAVRDAGATKVFIELRDVNYPGCTYSLIHDPQTDSLHGQYFQAAINQTFDVFFSRMK